MGYYAGVSQGLLEKKVLVSAVDDQLRPAGAAVLLLKASVLIHAPRP
jgi:hypothetical protein